ncbi:hypothetical protein NWP13_23795 [Rhodococcus pyridinivorans]|nr:hypothetical protein [Rhodococcus pyridinivorans]
MTQPSSKCGTVAGYMRHIRLYGEQPCDTCKTARADYDRERRANNVTIPKLLLAEMYLNAPIAVQERVEKTVGQDVIDQLVQAFDANEVAA